MNKIFFTLMVFGSSIAFSNTCSGDNCYKPCCNNSSENCFSCGCAPCDCSCECIPRPSLVAPCDEAYNAPYRIGVCWNVFASGSYLYWQTIVDGLQPGAIFDDEGSLTYETLDFDYEYNSGFKVAFGFNFDWDNWDFITEYTWLHHTLDVSDTRTASLFSYWNNIPQRSNKLATRWKFDFDQVDFGFGRAYFSGRRLILRPYFSGRVFWLTQNYDQTVCYTEADVDIESKGTAHFSDWAIGPRVGIQSKWCFCYGFSFYVNAGASLLYTEFESIFVTRNVNTVNEITKKESDRITFTNEFDIGFGLEWGNYVDACNKWYLTLSAGYEASCYGDQNPWNCLSTAIAIDPTLVNPICSNNLYFHGLTATARLDF